MKEVIETIIYAMMFGPPLLFILVLFSAVVSAVVEALPDAKLKDIRDTAFENAKPLTTTEMLSKAYRCEYPDLDMLLDELLSDSSAPREGTVEMWARIQSTLLVLAKWSNND